MCKIGPFFGVQVLMTKIAVGSFVQFVDFERSMEKCQFCLVCNLLRPLFVWILAFAVLLLGWQIGKISMIS